jgi:F0F1-type ATP synthase delta subunit
MVAWTWSEDFHLLEEINELLEVLDNKGFRDLPEKTILQCLSAIVQSSTSTKAILELDPKVVHNEFEKLVSSMEKAIDFLATQLNASSDFLPHVQQLIPLTFFFSRTNAATIEQTKWLKQWFWKASFSRRYAAQTDEKMDADIALFEQILAGNAEGLSKYNYSVTASQLVKQKFTRNSPLVRAFLLLLAQNKPVDLVNGAVVDLGKALSEYNAKEYHHIFPRAYLKNQVSREITSGLSTELREALQPLLREVESLNERIQEYDRRIERMAKEKYPETALLKQVKGVGNLIATTYVLTLEDPQRFRKSRDAGCFVGLQPGRRNSGESEPQMHISKQGDEYLRTLLVQGAHYILGPFGEDSDLRRWGQRLAARGGKNAKKRAVVAVARKLAVLLHRLWVSGEVYEPLRNSQKMSAAA